MTIRSILFAMLVNILTVNTASAAASFSTSNLTQAQKEKIKSALITMNRRIWDDKVVRCTIENSRKTMWKGDNAPHVYPSRQAAEQGIGMVLLGIQSYGLKEGNLNYSIKINGAALTNANGSAPVGITKRADDETDGKSKYSININTTTLSARATAAIAGTIFHEMLHNIGMSHTVTGNYDRDVKGHIIKEYGICIAGGGDSGLGLVADPYTYWNE